MTIGWPTADHGFVTLTKDPVVCTLEVEYPNGAWETNYVFIDGALLCLYVSMLHMQCNKFPLPSA